MTDLHDAEIVAGLGGGRLLVLFAPVGPGLCERCRARAEDVCYRIDSPDHEPKHGAVCGPCLVTLLSRP